MVPTIVGFVEKVRIADKQIMARVDTGATISSINKTLVDSLGLGPVVRTTKVASAQGKQVRPIVIVDLEIAGKNLKAEFSVANRDHMEYQILIGRNILKHGFLIDPRKEFKK